MNLGEYKPFYKRNLLLAFPVIISQVGQVTVMMADNMMVGHVGTPELAAAAFANNIFAVGMYFGMGITYGLTPLTGQSVSNLRKTAGWLKNGFLTHFVVGAILTIFLSGLYFLLPHMGQPEEVVKLVKPYFLWLVASYFPFMMFYSFKQFFEGIGNTKIAMSITLTANVINILGNYVFIFGKFGMPVMGLEGAGVGTFIARITMPLMFGLIVSLKPRFRRYYVLASRQALYLRKVWQVLKVGIPIGLQQVVELLSFSLGAIMMGWLGEVALASHQVAIGLAAFTYMISLGVASATTIRVSHQLGHGNLESLKKAAYASTHLVLFFMFTMAVLFILLNHYLPLLFTSDPEVVRIASGLIIVAAFFQIFDGLQVVMLGVLRGLSDVQAPMFFAFFAYILVGIPTSYFLTFTLDAGPQGIWYGFLVGLATAGILFYLRFRNFLAKRS